MGESFSSRVAGSLLNAIRLPELVTSTQNHYVNMAIQLATNPIKLKYFKEKLQINRLSTPLFDSAMFVKDIESAYVKTYERYQAELQPEHIYISN